MSINSLITREKERERELIDRITLRAFDPLVTDSWHFGDPSLCATSHDQMENAIGIRSSIDSTEKSISPHSKAQTAFGLTQMCPSHARRTTHDM